LCCIYVSLLTFVYFRFDVTGEQLEALIDACRHRHPGTGAATTADADADCSANTVLTHLRSLERRECRYDSVCALVTAVAAEESQTVKVFVVKRMIDFFPNTTLLAAAAPSSSATVGVVIGAPGTGGFGGGGGVGCVGGSGGGGGGDSGSGGGVGLGVRAGGGQRVSLHGWDRPYDAGGAGASTMSHLLTLQVGT
jgi:uncharacterized membrane protein YgcG